MHWTDKNEDNYCFKWCIDRALNPVKNHSERITQELRKQAEVLDWNGITFPTTLKEIDRFERNNSDISVKVFGYKGSIYPLRIAEHERKTIVDLLLISKDETKHYCLIKNLPGLLREQTGNHHMHYCRRCLNGFRDKEVLDKHKEYCNQHAIARVVMREPETVLTFKNHQKSMKHPFVVYADFESLIKPVDTCQPDPSKSYTMQFQKHTPSSFCYYIKCFDNKLYPPKLVKFTAQNANDNVAQIFVDKLEKDIKKIYKRFTYKKDMIFTKTDRKKIRRSYYMPHL